ncbi:hypothetical protein ACWFQ8_25225 [Streptomyces sp. NPDC055254]
MTNSLRWRVCLTSAASAVALVAAPLVGAQTAHAQYPPQPPCLNLGASTVPAGGTVDFRATGFTPRQLVTALLASDPIILGRYRADADGTAFATATIPKSVRAGWHTFKVTAHNPDRTCSARIKVRAAVGRPDHDGHDGHEHDGDSGQGPGGDDGRNGHNEPGRPDLADTGSEKALAASGIAAGLIALGGGTMLTVRRRRSA